MACETRILGLWWTLFHGALRLSPLDRDRGEKRKIENPVALLTKECAKALEPQIEIWGSGLDRAGRADS